MPRVVTTTRYVTTLRFMAYLTGTQVTSSEVDIARKRTHPECMSEERAVTESAYLTANTWHERCLPLERRTLESTRSMRRGGCDGLGEPGGPSRDLWVARSAMFEGNSARIQSKKNAIWFSRMVHVCIKRKKCFTDKFKTLRIEKWTEIFIILQIW